MAYGFDIRNDLGESVFEYKEAMIIQETGVTVDGNAFGINEPVGGSATRAIRSRLNYRTPFRGHYMKNQFSRMTRNDNFNLGTDVTRSRFPSPLVPRTSMYFYQVGTVGLAHHRENYITEPMETDASPQYGMYAICLPGDFVTPLPFIRVDTQKVGVYSETYGMQILDESGYVLFDSREMFLSVSEVLFVAKEELENVMLTGDDIVLPLRTAVPGCYISAPFHTSNFGSIEISAFFPKIWQSGPQELRISNASSSGGVANSNLQLARNDLVIIVARNPFA